MGMTQAEKNSNTAGRRNLDCASTSANRKQMHGKPLTKPIRSRCSAKTASPAQPCCERRGGYGGFEHLSHRQAAGSIAGLPIIPRGHSEIMVDVASQKKIAPAAAFDEMVEGGLIALEKMSDVIL